MKILALMILGLLVVGCGKSLEDKVVGTYELTKGVDTNKLVLLEDGIAEAYTNGKNDEHEYKWKIVDGEIHIVREDGLIPVSRINKDGSITAIAVIVNGKRKDIPKKEYRISEKIK